MTTDRARVVTGTTRRTLMLGSVGLVGLSVTGASGAAPTALDYEAT